MSIKSFNVIKGVFDLVLSCGKGWQITVDTARAMRKCCTIQCGHVERHDISKTDGSELRTEVLSVLPEYEYIAYDLDGHYPKLSQIFENNARCLTRKILCLSNCSVIEKNILLRRSKEVYKSSWVYRSGSGNCKSPLYLLHFQFCHKCLVSIF